MGLYDTVRFPCPSCGEPLDLQSKAGACELSVYYLDAVPAEIAHSVQGRAVTCRACGTGVQLQAAQIATVEMRAIAITECTPARVLTWQPMDTAPKDGTRILAECSTLFYAYANPSWDPDAGVTVREIWYTRDRWEHWVGGPHVHGHDTPAPLRWMPKP